MISGMETRRGLLKKSLGGAALLVVAGAVPVALRKTLLREPLGKLLFFTAAEYSIFAAVADAVLAQGPAGGLPPFAAAVLAKRPAAPTPAEVDVAGKADRFLAPLDAASARDLKQLLALFDNGLFSLFTGGPATPFTRKTPDQQQAQLHDWATSRLAIRRTGYQAMKRLCAAIYFGSPETYPSIGYPGPPVDLVRSVRAAQDARAKEVKP